MKATHYLDHTGAPLRVGDVVRILGAPDLHGMAEPFRSESEAVFRHLIGKDKRVSEFDEHGLAWLLFTIRSGPLAGLHAVGIEPSLLRIPGRRRARNQRPVNHDHSAAAAGVRHGRCLNTFEDVHFPSNVSLLQIEGGIGGFHPGTIKLSNDLKLT